MAKPAQLDPRGNGRGDMNRPAPKGWCPGALRPMQSGDGLIVRVRPRAGRLSRAQVLGLCAAAQAHGAGLLDLTNRANLQIRGVAQTALDALQDDLAELGLLDETPDLESRRNILTAPLRGSADDIEPVAEALAASLADLPDLPSKFGFAVDCAHKRQLANAPADIRIERNTSGGMIVRADGAQRGRASDAPVEDAIALAHWFAEHRGKARRMAQTVANLPGDWQQEDPAPQARPLTPGPRQQGMVLGAAFGSLDPQALTDLMDSSPATALVTVPGRLFLLEGAHALPAHPFIDLPGDPLLRVDACPGAPHCASASVQTREIARHLAPLMSGSLHVSGCAKGCARARPAQTTLVGQGGAFDLVRDGASWEEPALRGLCPHTLLTRTDPL